MADAGSANAEYTSVTPDTDLGQVQTDLGLSLIVKPPLERSTICITKVASAEGLARQLNG